VVSVKYRSARMPRNGRACRFDVAARNGPRAVLVLQNYKALRVRRNGVEINVQPRSIDIESAYTTVSNSADLVNIRSKNMDLSQSVTAHTRDRFILTCTRFPVPCRTHGSGTPDTRHASVSLSRNFIRIHLPVALESSDAMRRNRTPARPVGWRPPLAIHLHVRSCMRTRWRTHIRWTGALSDGRRAPPLMQRKCTPCVCVVRRLTSPPSCPSTFAPTGVGLAPMPTPAYPTATAKAPAILRRPQRPWPLCLREHARFAVRPCAVKIIGQAEALETVATSVVEVRDAVGPGVPTRKMRGTTFLGSN
jgi:hypothetical protein